MAREHELLTCRRILGIMIILCFMFQYMLRVNMAIAIVDMVAPKISNDTTTARLQWGEDQRHEILGSFFWGYLLGTIPGGRLAEIYGSKITFGVSMLLASILTLLIPAACYVHYYAVLAVRVVLGVLCSCAFPSLPPMVAKWIPPADRSKFMSHSAACSLGTAFTLLLGGYLIAQVGWPSIFYVTGVIGLVWSLSWFYLVYDSPEEHPRISNKEKEDLMKDIKFELNHGRTAVPWIKILKSGPVWAIIVANTCVVFNFFFILNELPLYMHQVLRFEIRENGLLSSLPYLATYGAAVVSSYYADRWIKSKKFAVITVRKIFCCIVFLGPAVLFSIQSFWGYNRIISVVVFTISLGFIGCYSAGVYSNSLDIAPAYSGTIYGLATASGALSGYATTKIVAVITEEQQDFAHWRYMFWILIIVNLLGLTFYTTMASAQLQNWNPKPKNETENEKLKSEYQDNINI